VIPHLDEYLQSLPPSELATYARNLSIDQDTGLLGRAAFTALLSQSCTGSFPMVLVVSDLIGLKELNDRDWNLGTRAIQTLADVVQAAVRHTKDHRLLDYTCRYGGDEIVVALASSGEEKDVAKWAPAAFERLTKKMDLGVMVANNMLWRLPDDKQFTLEYRSGYAILANRDRAFLEEAYARAHKAAYQRTPMTPRR
jgi:GGDEF domain-containing protein